MDRSVLDLVDIEQIRKRVPHVLQLQVLLLDVDVPDPAVVAEREQQVVLQQPA